MSRHFFEQNRENKIFFMLPYFFFGVIHVKPEQTIKTVFVGFLFFHSKSCLKKLDIFIPSKSKKCPINHFQSEKHNYFFGFLPIAKCPTKCPIFFERIFDPKIRSWFFYRNKLRIFFLVGRA
jgi:hypothetical protein